MSLTLQQIIEAQLTRSKRWHVTGLKEWSALEWAGAMAGETGEACNAAKKLKRIDGNQPNLNSDPGRHLTTREQAKEMIGKEVADAILYGISLCGREDIDLEACLIEAFNAKSVEYGFPERL